MSCGITDAKWAVPEGVSENGRKAAEIIRAYVLELDLLGTSGGSVFRDPAEWDDNFGRNSLLVVVHEGLDAGPCLSMDGAYNSGCGYALYEALTDRLRDAGLFIEQCTTWYSAIYEI
jgi:hypothetical protein